jgi:CheY-like chemotaxis protein
METYYPHHQGRDVRVLIIEDEKVSRKALAKLLATRGYTTEAVETAEEAVAILTIGQRPEVALVDLDLPGMSGSELVSYLIQKAPPIQTVLVTAACEERVSNLTEGTGIGYLRKPIDFNDLLRKLDAKPADN